MQASNSLQVSHLLDGHSFGVYWVLGRWGKDVLVKINNPLFRTRISRAKNNLQGPFSVPPKSNLCTQYIDRAPVSQKKKQSIRKAMCSTIFPLQQKNGEHLSMCENYILEAKFCLVYEEKLYLFIEANCPSLSSYCWSKCKSLLIIIITSQQQTFPLDLRQNILNTMPGTPWYKISNNSSKISAWVRNKDMTT